jgi:glutaredoxin
MFEVYGKDGCIYCEKALLLLNDRQLEYKYYKLGTDISVGDFRELFPTAKTVPVVMKQGNNIGGYDALKSYVEEKVG